MIRTLAERASIELASPSRQAQRSLVVAFATYFAIACVIGLLAGPMAPKLAWVMPAAQVAQNAGYNDPASFLQGAGDIARYGWVTPANYWLVHLWPPGFMVVEGVLLRIFGESLPILIPLLAMSALCCAAWMLLLRQYLLPRLGAPLASLAPLAPFLFPVTPFFMLSPVGLAFGETFSISFFIAGFLLLLFAQRKGSLWSAAGAGILLALSAYFRSQFEMLVSFLGATCVIVLALAAVAWALRRRTRLAPRTMLLMLVCVAAAQLAMLPWRLHNFMDSGKLAWVQTSDLVARASLADERTLLKSGGDFLIYGGGNLACRLEPSYCGETSPSMFFRAFFRNLGPWLLEKTRIFPEYWTAPPHARSMSSVGMPPAPPEILVNVILLGIILAAGWGLWRIRRRPEFAVQAWFQLSYYACLGGVYALAHFEARYFYLPKIFGVVALLTLLPALLPPHNSDQEKP